MEELARMRRKRLGEWVGGKKGKRRRRVKMELARLRGKRVDEWRGRRKGKRTRDDRVKKGKSGKKDKKGLEKGGGTMAGSAKNVNTEY